MSAIESNIQSSSAAGGGRDPRPNLDVNDSKISFEDDDLVWVQDENNRNWFPGQVIKENTADKTYDIKFNQENHPGVPIDQITKFELDIGDNVIVLNEEEDKFLNDNFKNGKISVINDKNRYNLDKDKYDVIYDDNTREANITLTHLAETDTQMLSNLAEKNKEDIDIGNSVLTTVDIFGKEKDHEGSVYMITKDLFATNKIDSREHKYNLSDIFDISNISEDKFVLTGIFNSNNSENLPPTIPLAIECYVNKDKTIIDFCVLLFIPSSLGDPSLSTVDGVFKGNYGQTGRDIKSVNVMSIMDGKKLINKSDTYMKSRNPNFIGQPNADVADLYTEFLNTNLNKDLFFNNVEKNNYINILFYLTTQRLFGIFIAQNLNLPSFIFKSNSEFTTLNFFFDIQTKIFTIKTKFSLLPIGVVNQVGTVLLDIIINFTNFSQSKIVLTPFINIPKGDYLFLPVTDITFDEDNLLKSKIEFTPPTTAEEIFPNSFVQSMINKINNGYPNDDGFNSELDKWIRRQIADKLSEILQGKLSLLLSNILSLQSSVRCLTEEKDNIYLLNYSTLNALVGIKENYTTLDLNTLWSALDRDIHGVSIYFNEIKYNLHNKEMVNADEELTSLTDFIMSNYKDVNGDNIHPNSLCQILLLISQGVGNAITEGLGVLLQNDNVTFVTITNNLLGNNVKKQFGITGNSIVIRSTKAKGEIGKSNRYIIGNRLNLINTFYFLLYNDGDPFAIVEIKINIDIQKDKFSVEYKTIGFFKYYDLMKTFYFGKFDNKQFPPAPNGSGSLSVYEQDKLEPVFTIQSDEWTNGILAKGAHITITDNRGTMVGGTKGGTSIQVGGGKPYRTVLTTDLDPNTFKNEDFMDFIDSEIENYKLKLTNITQERDDVKAVENAVKTENYLRSDNRIGNKSHQGIVLFDTETTTPDTNYVYIGPISPNGDKTVSISKKYGKILRFSKDTNTKIKATIDSNVSDKKYTVFIKPGKENSSDWDKFVLKPNFSKNYSNESELPLKWSIVRFGSVFDNFKFSLTNNSSEQKDIASELVTRVFRDLMVDPIANDLSLTKGLFEDTQRVFKMEKMIYIQVLIYFKILFVLLKRYDSNLISLPGYVSIKPLLNKLYEDYDSFTQFNEEVSDDYKYTAATDSATSENTATTTDNIDEELNSAPVSTLLSPIISSMDTKTNASVFEPINQNIDDPALLREYVLKAALLVLQNLGIVLQMYMNILGRMPVDEDANMVANYNPFALYPMYQKLVNVYNQLYHFYMGLKNNNDDEISDTLTKHNSATINKYLVSLALRIGTSSSLMAYGGYMSRKNKHKSYKRKFSKRISRNGNTKTRTTRNHNSSKIEREREQRYTRKL
jgi:hypothetical protein